MYTCVILSYFDRNDAFEFYLQALWFAGDTD